MANKKIQLSNGTDNLFPITSVIAVTISGMTPGPAVHYTVSGLTANHKVLSAQLSNPAAQQADWTVVTYDGYFTLTGTQSGTTDVTLVFYVPDSEITRSQS